MPVENSARPGQLVKTVGRHRVHKDHDSLLVDYSDQSNENIFLPHYCTIFLPLVAVIIKIIISFLLSINDQPVGPACRSSLFLFVCFVCFNEILYLQQFLAPLSMTNTCHAESIENSFS